ncbi:hypothetical protein A0E43_15745 [Pectobacterium cacticida]
MPGLSNPTLNKPVHVHAVKRHSFAAGLPCTERPDVTACHGDAAYHQIVLSNDGVSLDAEALECGMKVLHAGLETLRRVVSSRVGRVIDPLWRKNRVKGVQVSMRERFVESDNDSNICVDTICHDHFQNIRRSH